MKEQLLLLQKKALYLLPLALFVYTWYLYFSLIKAEKQNEKIEVPNLVFEAKRFVHLDLKGAPPKVSYYKHLFPFLAKLGTNGLLIEYEDMFPYSGDTLKHIPAENAYTLQEIATINSLAEENNLTVIPLVQTFGHLEFLLKLKKFKFLREVPKYPQVICPTHNMTLHILSEMLRQVIQAHPKSTMIHIGADEVYHIGECDRCKLDMYNHKLTNQQLFIRHIKRIASHIKLRYPHIKILMWDDEFRNIPIEELQNSGLNALVELVIWKYASNVLSEVGFELFNKYADIFKTLWFASAFKGATGSNKYLTSIEHHVSNHESWMEIYKRYKAKIWLPATINNYR
ncbi:glycoside hydrolase [Oryctes borbonicus]|uniref:beta-N-acetylhexosaminidase n=1 Tax=Oryctes borbonicus TaxID=1629725 RepID=A0A0T6AW31_9SCAR|nr:glycoside hydrolase [Oryctes borbonicus]